MAAFVKIKIQMMTTMRYAIFPLSIVLSHICLLKYDAENQQLLASDEFCAIISLIKVE